MSRAALVAQYAPQDTKGRTAARELTFTAREATPRWPHSAAKDADNTNALLRFTAQARCTSAKSARGSPVASASAPPRGDSSPALFTSTDPSAVGCAPKQTARRAREMDHPLVTRLDCSTARACPQRTAWRRRCSTVFATPSPFDRSASTQSTTQALWNSRGDMHAALGQPAGAAHARRARP